MSTSNYLFIVEHLDPELEDWQVLEYRCIAEECHSSQSKFLLSGLPSSTRAAEQLKLPSSCLTEQGVEGLYSSPSDRSRVCLLDPKASQDLSPQDGDIFQVYLFGGILGDDPPRGESFSITFVEQLC
jgi:ribosome biogenesis SPOUT family RNA methylase Rps3